MLHIHWFPSVCFFLVLPKIKPLQRTISPIIHSDLNVTCIVEGDPVPEVYWMKNDAQDIRRAQLSYNNRTLVIRDVDIDVDGVYMCVAANRAGNYSTSATVEILGECAIIYFFEANVTC